MSNLSLSKKKDNVFPSAVTVGGKQFPINADFRNILKILRLIEDNEVDERYKPSIICRWFYMDAVPPSALNVALLVPQVGVEVASGLITITADGEYTLTGETTLNRVVVAAGVNATVYLDSVSITNSNNMTPLSLENNTNISLVLLEGSDSKFICVLSRSNGAAGIRVPASSLLTISTAVEGSGKITATGGICSSINDPGVGGGAGIGGVANEASGTIIIEDGVIVATGGSSGAGIGGGGYGASSGNITINGGTIIASGGAGAPPQGSGMYGHSGGHGGGAGIGGGGANGFNGSHDSGTSIHNGIDGGINGIITINAGTITATGGNGGRGSSSGSNSYGNGGNHGSGGGGAGIGAGGGSGGYGGYGGSTCYPGSNGGNGGNANIININGGNLTSTGGTGYSSNGSSSRSSGGGGAGAGIGGGGAGSGGGGGGGNGSYTVNAAKGGNGGNGGSGGIITITGGNTTASGSAGGSGYASYGTPGCASSGVGGGGYGGRGAGGNSSGSGSAGANGYNGANGSGCTLTINNVSNVKAYSSGTLPALHTTNQFLTNADMGFLVNAKSNATIGTTTGKSFTSIAVTSPNKTKVDLELPSGYDNFAFTSELGMQSIVATVASTKRQIILTTGTDTTIPSSNVLLPVQNVKLGDVVVDSVIVNFDAAGGNPASPTQKEVTVGGKYGVLPVVERTGYNFIGWFLEDE